MSLLEQIGVKGARRERNRQLWLEQPDFVYDLLIEERLDAPSLTVQWMPDLIMPQNRNYDVHRVIYGTNSPSPEQNWLTTADIKLPRLKWADSFYKPDLSDEIIKIDGTFRHEGRVNRARLMPQSKKIVATFTQSGPILLYDIKEYGYKKKTLVGGFSSNPKIRLIGHKREGNALAWNQIKKGQLLSGSNDKSLILWDANEKFCPVHEIKHHEGSIKDIAWHINGNVFGAVDADKTAVIGDTRMIDVAIRTIKYNLPAEVNSIAFSNFSQNLAATGCSNSMILLWDIRIMKTELLALRYPYHDATKLEFSPHCPKILASAGTDGNVILWDMAQIGIQQSPIEVLYGPPEVLYVHKGHNAAVSDIAWNPNSPWTICSVAEDRGMQIWQIGKHVYRE